MSSGRVLPRATVWALALALALPAAAASPRIAVAPVKGDRAGELGAQLVAALCTAHRCIPGALAGPGSRLKRARRKGVEAIVFAAVVRDRSGRELAVSLVGVRGRTLQRWRVPLGRPLRIPPDQLEALAGEIQDTLRPPSRRPAPPALRAPPPPPPPPPAPPAEPPPAEPDPAPRGTAPAPIAERPDPADGGDDRRAELPRRDEPPSARELRVEEVVVLPPSRPDPSAAPRRAGPRAPPDDPGPSPAPRRPSLAPMFAGELGVDSARRALRFPAGGPAPAGYAIDLIAVPRLRLELLPLRAGSGAALGVLGESAYLPTSQLATGAQRFRVGFVHLRGGLVGRLVTGGGLALRAGAGYEHLQLALRATNGARIPHLPDSVLSGPWLGLELAQPLGASRFTILAALRTTWWLRAGELAGGADFFPGGRAFGVDGEAGLSLRLADWLSANLLACYGTTRWTLDRDPTETYTSRAATSDRWGTRVTLRLEP